MTAQPSLQVAYPEPDIAVVTLDVPGKGANVLSQSVLAEISAALDTLERRPDLAGIVIRSGKTGQFIAGADLREFAAAKDVTAEQTVSMCTLGRRLFQRLSQCGAVTVAAIDGVCLGGGAELAVWCDRRLVASDAKAQIGFPEVKLGFIPGWGGTARTPRLIGLGNAVEMISSGEPVDARAAVASGLASDAVPAARLVAAAIALVRAERQSGQYLRDRQRASGPLDITDTELAYLGATASAYIQQQTKGHYPAPLAALEVMLGAARSDIEAACQAEAEAMAGLFGTPVNRALINVFFLSDRNKKDPGVDRRDVQPAAVRSVSVLGAGLMGSAIAAACVKRDLPVALNDAIPEALARGVRLVLEEVSYNKSTRGPDVQRALDFAPRVNATTSDAELAAADLVIEAVVETEDIKRALYARIEPLMRPDAILASNTSTIPIAKLSRGLARPERFCGIHFFNPVRKMPLVEVIRGPQTSDETVVTAVAFAKHLGKSPIVVNDGPGFLVNRALFPYLAESLELVLEGVPLEKVDRVARDFGMPMGPIALYDVVGLDTAFYAGAVMYQSFPDRCVATPLVPALVKTGRLGQKSGAGFYLYKGKDLRGQPDPAVAAIVAELARPGPQLSTQQITERLFLPMLLEATRILQEKVVRDPRDVDLGLIYGIGFPPFKGGLLHWADTLGAAKIVEMLKPWEHLGERMRPTPLLLELARSGGRFYR
jgi:3-hydroxyacyl-CoA dehydrogenase/enoyl-CoA hydratase/3-hydroxybutyryl-CoA epimerase/3-hydroxyacyl-CoA dehydrogenase/enoyl-CoA hydratase/3-hydroxybutyryl-CoA epimerase/enoyl-CoA isomerase